MSRERIVPKPSAKQGRQRLTLPERLAAANDPAVPRWQVGRKSDAQLQPTNSNGHSPNQAAAIQRIRERSLRGNALSAVEASGELPVLSPAEMKLLGSQAAIGAGLSPDEAKTAPSIDIIAHRIGKPADTPVSASSPEAAVQPMQPEQPLATTPQPQRELLHR